MIIVRIVIIIILGIIFWQDYKERMVYWFMYPLLGLLGFITQSYYNDIYLTLLSSIVNLCLILTMLLVLYVYSKFFLKKKLIGESIGIGDVLFFIFLSFCFSIVSFLILFVFSLVFSLVLHVFLRKKKNETVPLAGYMSVFFAVVYCMTFFMNFEFLFAY